jgi:hypothetical protein
MSFNKTKLSYDNKMKIKFNVENPGELVREKIIELMTSNNNISKKVKTV